MHDNKTQPETEKQRAHRQAMFDRLTGASAPASPEPAGPSPVVGSGGVVGLRGIESEILRVATALEHNAMTREAIVGEWLPLDGFQNKLQLEAIAMRESAKILRRHVASESERQPEPNGRDEPRAGSAATPKQ